MTAPSLEFTLAAPEGEATPIQGPLTSNAYARMLKALLPPGRVWRFQPDSLLSLLLLGCGDELERVDGRSWDVLTESDPSRADEFLVDYERVLGLTATGTTEGRVAAVVGRLIRRQRLRPMDIQLAVASALGQSADDVDLRERTAAWAASVGDQAEIYRFFVYRDPDLPGTYSVAIAQSIVDDMKPSHTAGYVVESLDLRCDEATSQCDRDTLGV